ncbi:cold shock CspA family protein [Bradyrhizobium sp. GM6.1]
MIGVVAFESEAHRIALVTPSGKTRDYDILVRSVWFHVAGLGHPHKGLVVEFDIDDRVDGGFEAVNVRIPQLQPPHRHSGTRVGGDGAAPAAVLLSRAAAGNNPEVR